MITATLVFIAFCLGFFVAGLMAEAQRSSREEERNTHSKTNSEVQPSTTHELKTRGLAKAQVD